MTIIAIWSVFLGKVTFCEFLVSFPIIPFFAVFIWWAYGTCLLVKDRIVRFETLMKWNFRSDKILEIVTLWLVFISGSEGRVFWFSSVFDCKSNFFEPHGFSTCTPVQEGRCWSGRIRRSKSHCRFPGLWFWLGLRRMKFWNSILQGSWSLLGLPVTEF